MTKYTETHKTIRKTHETSPIEPKKDLSTDEAEQKWRDRELEAMMSPFWAWRALYR